MIKCVFTNLKLKVQNHQLLKVIHRFSDRHSSNRAFRLVLTRARRLERELEDAEERAEMVTTTLIRARSVHRANTDYE